MMSVGCYNFTEKKWEVGPELKDSSYDPIADMYKDSMKQAQHLVKDIRNTILDVYELALVVQKTNDEKFRDVLAEELKQKISDAGRLFKKMKKARSAFQKDPVSKEDALQKRADRKWKTTDAAFKLFDKFGYVKILKTFLGIDEKIEAGEIDGVQIAQEVSDAVKANLATNKMLDDSEK